MSQKMQYFGNEVFNYVYGCILTKTKQKIIEFDCLEMNSWYRSIAQDRFKNRVSLPKESIIRLIDLKLPPLLGETDKPSKSHSLSVIPY